MMQMESTDKASPQSPKAAGADPAEGLYEKILAGARVPGATYRVQLNHAFTFQDAAVIVEYLEKLGVTDLYASPFFKARPGSMHGYDLVDHNSLNPEIGTSADFDALHERLVARGMGLLLDFVPNHMGVHTAENAWWMDVLENGPSSLYAPFFDIDWHPLKSELERRVLLPVLGEHYGKVLENGDLELSFDHGAFFVRCYGNPLPLSPRTFPLILEPIVPSLARALGEEDDVVLELMSILTGLGNLPPQGETHRSKVIERRREKEILKRRLAALVAESPAVARAIEEQIRVMNGQKGDPRSFDALDALLENQAYRLSYWRVAAEEVNYRRFFDINDLGAIRMENPVVFEEAHRLLFQLMDEGKVTGLRIDHPDGLWAPSTYFCRLQRTFFLHRVRRELEGTEDGKGAASALQSLLLSRFDRDAERRPEDPPRPLYIAVEKILSRSEELPRDWAVQGTSGYDFAALASALFVDRSAERTITSIYEGFTGLHLDFGTLAYQKKKVILESSLASELNVLASALNRISERDRHTRDFTLGTLTDALREVIACFPVYRTYLHEGTTSVAPRDAAAIRAALRAARRRNPTMDASVYSFLGGILLLERPPHLSEQELPSRRDFVMRFQQLTGPVTAKGLEDTAFYVYNRLVSLNEVGGEPERFGITVDELHRGNEARQRLWPSSMLTTSTHDTKRSEDVRARINVLSELPSDWAGTLYRLAEATALFREELEGISAPDRNEEYLYYQTLLGTWPFGAESASPAYVERLVDYMRKATKEAKVNTSWTNADPTYDAAVEHFVRKTLADGPETRAFREALLPLARTVAYHGMWGSIAQVLLKLTSPGVPDIYQGNELWDFSLVDPDNRRPVDFGIRKQILAEIEERRRAPESRAELSRALVESASDGRIKLYVTRVALEARRQWPALFGPEGAYVPLGASGPGKDHVVAFARRCKDQEILVVTPRLTARLSNGRSEPPIGAIWGETTLQIDSPTGGSTQSVYENLFTGETIEGAPADAGLVLPLSRVLGAFPVALLSRKAGGSEGLS
ncbi:malto-oligosyltrehalose synthase [Polyangium jinanense]|uniref:Malto-oligosyltrehalose synthase n=1 Tax=Polyangium jinanense TaxID=2829994 RepID=A0A9X4AZB2_9BACT|nr:malto-oligosyltrehalose synthase [Polyangium jinanense]MDC3961633.1 malto-oligosyltrehalose synthase [Polyangium jinanense]MDC3988145.1 malto-oligosyltrehalose synthase [Polyangium jinanense]